MASAVVPGPFSIAVASSVAKGHYDTGLVRYEQFRALASPSPERDDVAWFQQVMEVGISAVTNFALSLELSLKILHFQHTGKYPNGHDIAKLGAKFPETTLLRLRHEYARLREDPNKPQMLAFNFRGSEDRNIPQGTWPGEAATYDEAVAKVGAAYVRWRYIYEEFGASIDVSVSFEHLIVLVKTVNLVSGSHAGNSRISI